MSKLLKIWVITAVSLSMMAMAVTFTPLELLEIRLFSSLVVEQLTLKVINVIFVLPIFKFSLFICAEIVFFVSIARTGLRRALATRSLPSIPSTGLSAARRLCDIEALGELVVLSLINEVLAINIRELIIMSVNDYLRCHDTLEPVVVSLDDDLMSLPVTLGFGGLWLTVGENIVVMAVDHDLSRFGVLLKYDLVIMAIDGDAFHVVLRFHVERYVVVVNNQALRFSLRLRLRMTLPATSVASLSVLLVLLLLMRMCVSVGLSVILTPSAPPVASLVALCGLLLRLHRLVKLRSHIQALVHQVRQLRHSLHILVDQVLLGHMLALTLMMM